MSFINDLAAEVHEESASIVADTQTASATGSGVDVTSGDAVVMFDLGNWTDGTHSFTISGSDDGGSSWTAVSTAEKVGAGSVPTLSGTATSGSVAFQQIENRGNYDQIRVSSSVAGATTGAVVGAYVLEINETSN